MTGILLSRGTLARYGDSLAAVARETGIQVRAVHLPDDPVHEMHTLAALPELLARCDWVVLACPLTLETRRIINTATLARLPRGAHLVNVARGEVVDEAAVIAALRSGQLGGAYLDVFEKEPLPADSPLWDLPNAIVSPHNASASSGNDDRAMRMFLANLVKWAQGKPLQNEV